MLTISEEDEFLSDLDTLVGMSASEDVCDFLASPTSDCLPMLVAELLLPTPFGPVQQACQITSKKYSTDSMVGI